MKTVPGFSIEYKFTIKKLFNSNIYLISGTPIVNTRSRITWNI